MLVVDVQGRSDPVGNDTGTEATRGPSVDPPIEDELDLVRPAEVEVLADDFLEEDTTAGRPIQHLGQGKLGLQDREIVAVSRLSVLPGEGVRQPTQPLPRQGLDLLRGKAVADGLRSLHVLAGEDPVVQGLEGDALVVELLLEVLVAIEAQLPVVREVRAELQEEGSEVCVQTVEVEMVDHGRVRGRLMWAPVGNGPSGPPTASA